MVLHFSASCEQFFCEPYIPTKFLQKKNIFWKVRRESAIEKEAPHHHGDPPHTVRFASISLKIQLCEAGNFRTSEPIDPF